MSKKIGIVTGTRAEYGLLSRTIELLQNDDRFETCIFACGTHLSPEYGYTISELRDNNVKNIVSIEMLLSSSSKVGIAKSVGIATMSFADAFTWSNLDAILVLGDRYEMFAAAQAAMFLDISLIHIHGGEVTEGAFDDSIRHSITKMANIHFPVAEQFAKRIQQLGERKSSIFVVGSPGVDNIINAPRMTKHELESSLDFVLSGPIALVTYHPVTKTANSSENDISSLISAIIENPQLTYIITYPNADNGGNNIIEQWQSIVNLSNIKIIPSLGFKRYISIMEFVDCVIGNSSSGIIEAPSFNVPTINIGTRQKGRPRASSVLDVEMNKDSISNAINKSCEVSFKESLQNTINPYGKGGAAQTIVDILAHLELPAFNIKTFTDHKIDE
ncbi:UDP-N-acetylglucosamine 2-epimerase [Colwellia sp. TT2012]|uniref:UDP-N-acetylglucosamine 2-epimerase n=1 Tax=Colwellia sp. TT2012 TaxID=1720342 RepID=UPI00071096A0|nr:UDP-N-acetylglucosamine 2-epimerase [Colwellia sp. TT2012]